MLLCYLCYFHTKGTINQQHNITKHKININNVIKQNKIFKKLLTVTFFYYNKLLNVKIVKYE